jgi:hypothetical protein
VTPSSPELYCDVSITDLVSLLDIDWFTFVLLLSWECWFMTVVPALVKQRQENQEFKASLAAQWDPDSRNKTSRLWVAHTCHSSYSGGSRFKAGQIVPETLSQKNLKRKEKKKQNKERKRIRFSLLMFYFGDLFIFVSNSMFHIELFIAVSHLSSFCCVSYNVSSFISDYIWGLSFCLS